MSLGTPGARLLFEGLKGKKGSSGVETNLTRQILAFRVYPTLKAEYRAGWLKNPKHPQQLLDDLLVEAAICGDDPFMDELLLLGANVLVIPDGTMVPGYIASWHITTQYKPLERRRRWKIWFTLFCGYTLQLLFHDKHNRRPLTVKFNFGLAMLASCLVTWTFPNRYREYYPRNYAEARLPLL